MTQVMTAVLSNHISRGGGSERSELTDQEQG